MGTLRKEVAMKLSQERLEALERYIPDYMREGVKLYIEKGIPPGGFLTAVICNDLKGAVARADETNRDRLPDYVMFFYNFAPADCWGSEENMSAWFKRFRDDN